MERYSTRHDASGKAGLAKRFDQLKKGLAADKARKNKLPDNRAKIVDSLVESAESKITELATAPADQSTDRDFSSETRSPKRKAAKPKFRLKLGAKGNKTTEGFRLYSNVTGCWAKRIRGKTHLFWKVEYRRWLSSAQYTAASSSKKSCVRTWTWDAPID